MADDWVTLADTTKIQTYLNTVAGTVVETQAMALVSSTGVPLGTVANPIAVLNGINNNRTAWNGYVEAVAGTVTDALVNLNVSSGYATAVAATSYTVPAGKTLRLISLVATWVATTTTANTTRIRMRVNTAGAAVIGSPLVWSARLGWPSATFIANEAISLPVSFPDGMEIPAGSGLAFSHIEAVANGTLDLAVTGFLY